MIAEIDIPKEKRRFNQSLAMNSSSKQLAGSVVIVTCSVGNLGSATAGTLQEAGAKTILVDRSQDRLRESFPDLIDSPYHFLAGGIDLTNAASLAKIVQSACDRC